MPAAETGMGQVRVRGLAQQLDGDVHVSFCALVYGRYARPSPAKAIAKPRAELLQGRPRPN
jgi:hypothetical protein